MSQPKGDFQGPKSIKMLATVREITNEGAKLEVRRTEIVDHSPEDSATNEENLQLETSLLDTLSPRCLTAFDRVLELAEARRRRRDSEP